MNSVFIYALKDPQTLEIRYVGKAKDPSKRFRLHFAAQETCHRTNWIKSLTRRGLKPTLEILDEVPEAEWQQWEVAYIEYFREAGCDLVNSTFGGEGAAGFKHSLATCAKRSARFSGAGNPNFGKKQTPETIENRVAKNTGKKRNATQCENLRRGTTGVKHKNNTSGFVGIFWNGRNRKWRADFQLHRKKTYVGEFRKIEDAVFARALAIAVQ